MRNSEPELQGESIQRVAFDFCTDTVLDSLLLGVSFNLCRRGEGRGGRGDLILF